MKRRWIFGFIALAVACAPSRFVQPLEKGQHAVGFSFGGGLIDYSGMTIPLPLTTLVYGYGLREDLTVFGSLHTTSLVFSNFQTDIGGVYRFYRQIGYVPTLTGTLAANFIADLNDPVMRFWPEADLNASWNWGKNNHYAYVGCSNWFELRKTRSHDQPQLGRWVFNPHIGNTFRGKGNMEYTIELKLMAPGRSNEKVFVPWQSLTGKTGATGVYFSIVKKF